MFRDDRSWVLVALLATIGCDAALDTGPAGPRGGAPPTSDPTCESGGMDPRNDVIRRGLARTCEGCHSVGEHGYFASAVAFESLLVRNPRLVVPGDPDGSALVQLLEGRREGSTFSQMPLSGDPFAVMAERGETDVSMEAIRSWIRDLTVPGVSTEPDVHAATVQRISATHVELGLRDLLGLTEDDFWTVHPSANGSIRVIARSTDTYPVRSPDRVAGLEGLNRFEALGGGSAIAQRSEDRTPSTTFVQTLVPLSQAWCALAVQKVGNTALFTVATPATGSADDASLRAQIADWHLLFLAEPARDEDVDTIVNDVFVPLEAENDAQTAWIGTCAYFVRHPLFVLY
ncbi:hypothetical protein [Sandaracinus amylolyticus]|uniref:Cytochrome c domain-containing protein n=1 Tax=Sandaracinus amylolyticus TaxID=927083 RepID=A0A0F6VZP6_9BACT|nr:hypothetical protein [Sandaracinus amylolyticus]AKF03762.1 hypothetical protein DB32_000911 [Sandaracinus amylolyticus]